MPLLLPLQPLLLLALHQLLLQHLPASNLPTKRKKPLHSGFF
jgi:hypothetical protein